MWISDGFLYFSSIQDMQLDWAHKDAYNFSLIFILQVFHVHLLLLSPLSSPVLPFFFFPSFPSVLSPFLSLFPSLRFPLLLCLPWWQSAMGIARHGKPPSLNTGWLLGLPDNHPRHQLWANTGIKHLLKARPIPLPNQALLHWIWTERLVLFDLSTDTGTCLLYNI